MRTETKEERKLRRDRDEEREREGERKEGDQRHVEFTITLLGCSVIKEKSPWRERRL